jgi:hypothetical protein
MAANKRKKSTKASAPSASNSASSSTQHKGKNPESEITITPEQMVAFQAFLKNKSKKKTQESAKEKKAQENKSNIFLCLFFLLTN